ncbi:SRPBCC domain-containing protein [Pseudaminobacter sp. 19-2017]|uniref:SRPBCC domain-containing protein n=1 Tax=Pseudaminobacter soli (ex Zhang et al. 2022) TaxID=2831468 RepID=A0A942DXC8_9HYPH|nr:SRPBCC domain-containing protein [Pseudaminobacter soli]MBS3647021.1 SRPBCC domain-containing protein [Pseudaminobacter soli]
MTETTVEDGNVVVECEFDAPPERIWRALSVEELAADWLDSVPAGSERAEAPSPQHARRSFEIIDRQPPTRITYRWQEGAGRNESFVTVELCPQESGRTLFRLTHSAPATVLVAANANAPRALAA